MKYEWLPDNVVCELLFVGWFFFCLFLVAKLLLVCGVSLTWVDFGIPNFSVDYTTMNIFFSFSKYFSSTFKINPILQL
ncbi:Predicted protein [Komagataella phaffii CBS 7435]|nr:Predicted protein [Komagataella phaffii CBS 7435]